MREFVRAVIVLIILAAAYWGWAVVGAAQLASFASQGNVEAVMQRVDLPALKRSLGGQIAHAYLDQNPQFKKLLSIEQKFVGSVGAGAADTLLREVLTPENIAAFLNKGRADFPNSGASFWRMPPLSEAFRTGPLQALINSYFDGPLSFVIKLDSAEGLYKVHLHLSGTSWRLSGIDIPEEIRARMAREIAERVGGSAERRGG
jgi:hypothetical protein